MVSVFRSRPALRWLVPSAAAVVVIGGGAAAGTIVASADPSLPDRSAAQLLVDVQSAKIDGLSGTVVQSADLGLPAVGGSTGAGGAADLTRLLAGSNTARVWYAGDDKQRLALVGTDGETDVIRNGTDVWLWNSSQNKGTHVKIPANQQRPESLSSSMPATPQEAADAALAAISPSTDVSTTGAAEVAGRDAYELVLTPKDAASLIGQVRLAIDAEHHIPLRVDVYAKNATSPAVRVAFQQITFDTPDAQQFAFNPPPGAQVEEASAAALEKQHQAGMAKAEKAQAEPAKGAAAPKVLGTGWTSVVTAKLPAGITDAKGEDAAMVQKVVGMLPAASGSWGKGHVFAGTLFSVLVTDDGRVFGGFVTPETLYQAAAK